MVPPRHVHLPDSVGLPYNCKGILVVRKMLSGKTYSTVLQYHKIVCVYKQSIFKKQFFYCPGSPNKGLEDSDQFMFLLLLDKKYSSSFVGSSICSNHRRFEISVCCHFFNYLDVRVCVLGRCL